MGLIHSSPAVVDSRGLSKLVSCRRNVVCKSDLSHRLWAALATAAPVFPMRADMIPSRECCVSLVVPGPSIRAGNLHPRISQGSSLRSCSTERPCDTQSRGPARWSHSGSSQPPSRVAAPALIVGGTPREPPYFPSFTDQSRSVTSLHGGPHLSDQPAPTTEHPWRSPEWWCGDLSPTSRGHLNP